MERRPTLAAQVWGTRHSYEWNGGAEECRGVIRAFLMVESARFVGAMRSLPHGWEFAETAWRERGLMATRKRDSFRCPSCDSRDIRRSMRRRLLDPLYLIFGFLPFRCEDCNHRFYKWIFS